jgi:hypothetical protein
MAAGVSRLELVCVFYLAFYLVCALLGLANREARNKGSRRYEQHGAVVLHGVDVSL